MANGSDAPPRMPEKKTAAKRYRPPRRLQDALERIQVTRNEEGERGADVVDSEGMRSAMNVDR